MGIIYEQLSIEEWTMIQTQLEMGIRPAAIAVGLNRSESTLSHELRRNGWTRPKTRCGPGRPPVAGGYRAEAAVLADPERLAAGHLFLIAAPPGP
jgi:IS30 family transposase